MIKNKKGTIGMYLLVLFMLFFIGYTYLFFSDAFDDKESRKHVGSYQKDVLQAYESMERAFLYLDISVEEASKMAIKEMSSKGGFQTGVFEDEKKEYPCGAVVYPVVGYGLDNDKCITNIKTSFPDFFFKNFNKLIANYKEVNLLNNDFDIKFVDRNGGTDIVVSSLKDIVVPIYARDIYISKTYDTTPSKGFDGTPNEDGYVVVGGLKSLSRNSVTVDTIVLHYTVTKDAKTAFNVLQNRGLSYHYVIDKDGTIYNFVDEERSAQHAGCAGKNEEKCPVGYNSRSIGISLVSCGFDDTGCHVEKKMCYNNQNDNRCWEPYTPEQVNSVVQLIADIAYRQKTGPNHNFEISTETVIPHSQVDKEKSDIGPAFNIPKVVNIANERLKKKLENG